MCGWQLSLFFYASIACLLISKKKIRNIFFLKYFFAYDLDSYNSSFQSFLRLNASFAFSIQLLHKSEIVRNQTNKIAAKTRFENNFRLFCYFVHF